MAKIKIPAKSSTKFKDNWKRCVGTGRMGLALQKEYQDLLSIVQEHIGFDYLRGHGLLTDDMGIYRDKKDVGPVYNFTYLDRVFDSFLSQKIKPFVELGFMPNDLAGGNQTVFYWKGNVTPPKDYGLWRNLIKTLVRHLIYRYGVKEVRNWPFEVWNEPDLAIFWQNADQKEYFKLYRETALAIKEVDSAICVGGPATCPGAIKWIGDFLAMCDKEKAPVDFVSQHSYCAKAADKGPELVYQNLLPNVHLLNQFSESRGHIIKSVYPDDMPLHITEYNTSYNPRCPVHDTAYNAAFLGRTLSEGGDYADSFSYWTFCDVFEEEDVPQSQFHGGFGLVGLNGVVKPTFHLFAFFARLGSEQLYRDNDMIVTRRDDGSIAIVAWNPVAEKRDGFKRQFEMEIPLSFGEVLIKQQTVDEENGNAWNAWRTMGRPRYPDKRRIETLKQAATPAMTVKRQQIHNGMLNLSFSLNKNGICLIELSKLADETNTYPGLDDSRVTSY
ncbi:MAG: xylan 1,4-beta-xylosidase [Phycisphaerae bacterium]|jgi:xylan 1,4-beta-xylosidase